jgi:Cys-tRNA(Pro) deacylase
MVKDKIPTTLAVRMLREHKVAFTPFFYAYEDHGGTGVAAASLRADEHQVIKTLIFKDDNNQPLIMLMHGDRQVSTKALARQLERKSIEPVAPVEVNKLTGYQVGGVSPFGTLKKMPVFAEKTILSLPHIFINGGKRGFLVKIAPAEISRLLRAVAVQAAI